MTWSVNWNVVDRPADRDPMHPSAPWTVIPGEVVEFQLVSDEHNAMVAGRDPANWVGGAPSLTVIGTQTVGPVPPYQREVPLVIRYRFSTPGRKLLIFSSGRLRVSFASPPTTRHQGAVHLMEQVHIRRELDVLHIERGRVAATVHGVGGREVLAAAREEERAHQRATDLERRTRALNEERRNQFRNLRNQRLRGRGRGGRYASMGVVPWPFLDDRALAQLTDDEVRAYLYGLGAMIDVSDALPLYPQHDNIWVDGQSPLSVNYHFRIESDQDGSILTWRQPIPSEPSGLGRPGRYIRDGEREYRRYRANDLLAVRYEQHGQIALVQASDLASELLRHQLTDLAWQVAEFVIIDLVVRIAMPALWVATRVLIAALQRVAVFAVRVASWTAEGLLEAALRIEARLMEREAVAMGRGALREARATGGRLWAETERREIADIVLQRQRQTPYGASSSRGTGPRPDTPHGEAAHGSYLDSSNPQQRTLGPDLHPRGTGPHVTSAGEPVQRGTATPVEAAPQRLGERAPAPSASAETHVPTQPGRSPTFAQRSGPPRSTDPGTAMILRDPIMTAPFPHPEEILGLGRTQLSELHRLLGRPLTSPDMRVFDVIWRSVANQSRKRKILRLLTRGRLENARALARGTFNSLRRSFWRAVRRDTVAMDRLRRAGFRFPEEDLAAGESAANLYAQRSRPPYLRIPHPAEGMSDTMFLDIDHRIRLHDRPDLALDSFNLRMATRLENQGVFESLRRQDVFGGSVPGALRRGRRPLVPPPPGTGSP